MLRRVVIGLLIAIVFTAQCCLMVRYAPQVTSGYDFYPRWAGARALWLEGRSPYSDQVTTEIQTGFFGHPVEPGQDQICFAYPLYFALLLTPLAVLPYPLAYAIWTTALFYLCLVSGWLAMRLMRWRPPVWLSLITVVWSALFYPNARSILVGQPGLLVLLFTLLTMLALQAGRDIRAGLWLALATVKPQMALFPVLWMLWWGLWQRRWRFLLSCSVVMVLLFAASFIALPTWLLEFVRQVLAYPSYMHPVSVVGWLSRDLWPGLGRAGELAPTLLLLALLAWLWWDRRKHIGSSWLWTTAVTLTVANLVLPLTAATFYTTLLMPLVLLFHWLDQRAGRWGRVAILGSQVTLLIGLSAVFLATISGSLPYEADLIPLPLLLFVALLLTWRYAD